MKILFATDDSKFSEAAAKSLVQQFRAHDTEVRVLHVVEPIYDLSTSTDVPRVLSGAGGSTPTSTRGRRAGCENALFCWLQSDHVSHHRRPEERHFGRCLRMECRLDCSGLSWAHGAGALPPRQCF